MDGRVGKSGLSYTSIRCLWLSRLWNDLDHKSTELASAISEAPDRTTADIITLILAVALCRFVRLLYPCLTVSELDKAEKTVQSTFSDAINNGCLYGHKLEIITQSKLRLRKRAAERREKFQLNNSIWKNFIGIDIELVPDIVQWYTAAERLQRDILQPRLFIHRLQRGPRNSSRKVARCIRLDVDIGIEDQAPRPKSTWVLLLPDIRNTDDFTPSISTTTVL
ncbi:hypothetical protein Moror_12281, partial [Moniliophthora roreri MCA 2997]